MDAVQQVAKVDVDGETSKMPAQNVDEERKEIAVGIKFRMLMADKADIQKYYTFGKVLENSECGKKPVAAYGEVHMGKRLLTGETVAIKKIAKEGTIKDSKQNALEEIKILNELVRNG